MTRYKIIHQKKKKVNKVLKKIPFETCPKSFWLWGECEKDEEKFIMPSVCGKENCPVCGKEGSYAHIRRYKRGLGFVLFLLKKYEKMGYWVITSPKKDKEEWKSIERIKEVEKYIKRLFKRELKGISGVMRWHWGGDKSREFYPHLNVLISYGYIEKEKLNRIKELIKKKFGIMVCDYGYTRSKRVVAHWWYYISRPTFLLQNEISYDVIKNKKNVIYFGKEKNEEKMNTEDFWRVAKELNLKDEEREIYFLLNNRCPKCGEKIRWRKFNRSVWDDFIREGWGVKYLKRIFKDMGLDFNREDML